MVDEITLSIDGQEVKTQPGKMIIEAAMDAGKYIPYLCYYPGMKPYGACRMCVVEVEGAQPPWEASLTHHSSRRGLEGHNRFFRTQRPAPGHHGIAHLGASPRLSHLPSS